MFQDGYLFYTKNQYNQLVVCGMADKTIGKIIVPETVSGKTVNIISGSAFEGCLNIEEIILPNTIRRIGKNAFKGCVNLKKVVVHESTPFIKIGTSVFQNCSNLELFQCSALLCLDDYCFANCLKLKSFESPVEGLIPYAAFQNCPELSKLIIFEQTTGIHTASTLHGCQIKDIYFRKDMWLSKPILQQLKGTTIHCSANSEFVNLAYDGYKIIIEEL